ncbi:hypothetical protein BGX24_001304 [Mortierella sp. AD032]|nr:hypothetical protein BGX24_001304 [Mortierella sp. AD032]
MTNPSEIESHPVESLKAQKQHDAAHPNFTESLDAVSDHPMPPMAQAGLNALQFRNGADIIGIPHTSPKEGHHEHKHDHEHHVHHETKAAHDHHGNPAEPLKSKALGFELPQHPTM